MNDAAIHVLLVDDNDQFRESTAWLLEGAGFSVEAFAGGEAALQHIFARGTHLPPQTCIVSDIRMPGMNGMQFQAELKRRGCTLPLIFITGHGDVPLAVSAMRNGAANFIEKPFNADSLANALRTAVEQQRAQVSPSEAVASLSAREKQVLDLIMLGKPNKVIADVLEISIKTVEMHRAKVMSKLEAHNVSELFRIVLGQQAPHP